MSHFNPIIEVEPDQLYTPEVRQWALKKYKLVGSYCDIFTAGMKNKWNQLIYIDLFAGAGYAQIEETKKTYKNSALIAMSVPNPFTKYILCERDDARFKALESRVKREFNHLNYSVLNIDSNTEVDKILKEIPKYGRGNTQLSFCFVDPFSLNLKFTTVRTLGKGAIDFLILQALYMDANRNLESYLEEENKRIADYLGIDNWRKEYERNKTENNKNIVKFLADEYQNQMITLGYKDKPKMHLIESNIKRLPLYYLAFYSKHSRGIDFFNKVEKRIDGQTKLEF